MIEKTGRKEVNLPGRIYKNYPVSVILHICREKTRELSERESHPM